MYTLPLALMLLASPILQARFSDGLIVGGLMGATAGIIGSAVARSCSKPPVVVVEERPVVVERPVIVEKKVFVERPRRVVERVIVEKPVVRREVIVDNSAIRAHQENLVAREAAIQRKEARLVERQEKQRFHAEKEKARITAQKKALREQQQTINIEKAIEEPIALEVSLRERELALKEGQVELELIKAKKELLAEENKKKELALKEKELDKKRR